MTNAQLAAARKADRRFPDATFRPVDGGVEVNGVLVLIAQNMTPDDVFKALAAATYG
jgi:hypothetical protein